MDSCGTLPAAFAPLTYVDTSDCTVETLNDETQWNSGWLAILSRMTGVRESFGLAATQRATWVPGSTYSEPDSVPAEAEPVASRPPAVARPAVAATARAATWRRPRVRRGDTAFLPGAK